MGLRNHFIPTESRYLPLIFSCCHSNDLTSVHKYETRYGNDTQSARRQTDCHSKCLFTQKNTNVAVSSPLTLLLWFLFWCYFLSNTVWTWTDESSVLWRWCIRHDPIVSPACGIKDLCFKQRVADNIHKNTQLTTQGTLPVSHSKTPSGGSVLHTNTHDIIHQHPGSPTRVARLAMSDPIAPIVTCDQLVINL